MGVRRSARAPVRNGVADTAHGSAATHVVPTVANGPDSTGLAGNGESTPRSGARRGWQDSRVLLLPVLAFLGIFFLFPLWLVLKQSLFDPELTLDNYREMIAVPAYGKVLLRTFRLAAIVTVISVVLGYPVAYFIAHASRRLAAFVLLAVLVPLWTSLLVRTYAWIVLLGREGVINQWLRGTGISDRPADLLFNLFAVTIGMVHALLPFVILPLVAVMRGVEPSLVPAARSLGAGAWDAFWRVFFPLTVPGLATGALLVFILSLGFFVTPSVLGNTSEITIAMLIATQMQVTLDWGLGAALAVLLLVLAAAVVYLYQRRYGLDRLLGGAP